ncbi:hypothetical protein AK830_g2808 [Neonectria ditissima]|uniref:Nucleoside phosphorylase domain-containing protein n=1 Tax=Neonectria ditissima TaxID=78410 RepID=A0A0P7BRD4_9HYPO|nr:hypothetical protein AK830_g2808 [Neonectria ditissima]
MSQADAKHGNSEYTVGWICALQTEHVAAKAFLDERHEGPENRLKNDNNSYTLGRIGGHNVAIACLPKGEYGIASATGVAKDMLHSFSNIKIGLMVGLGGGAPTKKYDIRLGDVVVSSPFNGQGGVVQYDFGRAIQDQEFQPTMHLDKPPEFIRTAVSDLETEHEMNGHQFEETINDVLDKYPRLRRNYKRPDPSSDKLYKSHIIHLFDNEGDCAKTCGVDASKLVARPARTEADDNPTIHYGLVASGSLLMKDALKRDKLAEQSKVLCFETEAAGLMNRFPCLVIRGICSYSDSHTNKEWQGYAAMTAAAYAKALLLQIPPSKIEHEEIFVEDSADVYGVVVSTRTKVDTVDSHSKTKEDREFLDWISNIPRDSPQSDIFGDESQKSVNGVRILRSIKHGTADARLHRSARAFPEQEGQSSPQY